jgi:AcrR family transcriptional regulator
MRTLPAPRSSANGGAARRGRLPYRDDSQRQRLIAAMGQMTAELGWSGIGVHHVCQRAGVSRRTFYELYQDLEGCFLEAVDDAFSDLLAITEAAAAAAGADWEDRAVAATVALITALDADRVLAALCVIAPLAGNHAALSIRHDAVGQIADQLGDAPELPTMSIAITTGAIGAVFELAHRHLTQPPAGNLAELAAAAIYLLLVPFIGRQRAAERAAAPTLVITHLPGPTSRDLAPGPQPAIFGGAAITELGRLTLEHLHGHPGARNIDLCHAIDVRHESQMSRLLARLQHAGLITHRRSGRCNTWTLTPEGHQATRHLATQGNRTIHAVESSVS